MIRLKQNRYPVIFLTQGSTTRWPPYEDQRTSSISQAILYAINADILVSLVSFLFVWSENLFNPWMLGIYAAYIYAFVTSGYPRFDSE